MKSSNDTRVCAVLLCAGRGARTGLGYNKMLYETGGQTVLEQTLTQLKKSRVRSTVVVVAPEDCERVRTLLKNESDVHIVHGGQTRTQSVRNGLAALPPCDIAVIHDGARPFVSPQTIDASIDSAVCYGSGIVCVPTVDTIKRVIDGAIVETLPRDQLVNTQTPQTFRYAEIVDAYQKCDGDYTDDSQVYAAAGYTPHAVEGEYDNIKITTDADLYKLSAAHGKIGTGYDVHRLVEGRKLILGGVEIAHDKGLLGHSDADVLTHAVMDALLSAAGLPDIGVLFPDADAQYEGISSMLLLQKVMTEVRARGLYVSNLSAVVMAEKPKLAPLIPRIRESLAAALDISAKAVNVSATTTEKLGIIGEEKGMAASAVCLLQNRNGKH